MYTALKFLIKWDIYFTLFFFSNIKFDNYNCN